MLWSWISMLCSCLLLSGLIFPVDLTDKQRRIRQWWEARVRRCGQHSSGKLLWHEMCHGEAAAIPESVARWRSDRNDQFADCSSPAFCEQRVRHSPRSQRQLITWIRASLIRLRRCNWKT